MVRSCNLTVFEPHSDSELLEILNSAPKLRIQGEMTKSRWVPPLPESISIVKSTYLNRILDMQPQDQIVTVQAGCQVQDLLIALSEKGQTLPLPQTNCQFLNGCMGTVGGLIASNLPHGLCAQFGWPRDWVLHLETTFQGDIARSGAKVVKSVAGYDVHKVFAGSWGRLGFMSTLTLKTIPMQLKPALEPEIAHSNSEGQVWILKTLPSVWKSISATFHRILQLDSKSCTAWLGSEPERPPEGWIIGPNGARWAPGENKIYSDRLKSTFDPKNLWQ